MVKLAFDKEKYYGISLNDPYYREFYLLHDKILNFYEMMKENNISRLFFKIPNNKTETLIVRIFNYKRSLQVIVNSIEKHRYEIYDFTDTYKLYENKYFLWKGSRLFKHDLEEEDTLISRWME